MELPQPPEQRESGDSAAPDPSPAPQRSWRAAFANFAAAAVVILLALFTWHWYESRQQINALQMDLARRLADADAQNRESRTVAEQVREAMREAQVKLGVLENKLQESQNQQIALEALYQELSRSRDESVLADVEQTIFVANQQLQIAGNIKAALIALQSADNRLQRIDRPQFASLRKVMARDIERLKLAPFVDVVGISARLDNLIGAVDGLPLAMEVRPGAANEPPGKPATAEAAWTRFAREVWRDLRSLVRIENMERPDLPLLAPSQVFFLRENLKLRLLGARLSLLARDEKSFKADLKAVREWLQRYYDARDKTVAAAVATVRQLHDGQISIELPDVVASLDAVHNYRLTHERGR